MQLKGASQGTLSKDVKEDLKRIHLHPLKKYQSNKIVREQQIYGLTPICGNKPVTLPILKNLRSNTLE